MDMESTPMNQQEDPTMSWAH